MTEIDEVRTSALLLADEADLDPLLNLLGAETQLVLLGEGTHGTHEFVSWRAALTRQLVADHGFSFVAIETDQANCGPLDECIRFLGVPGVGAPDPAVSDPGMLLDQHRHWPSWWLANAEMVEFCRWLRTHNASRPLAERTGLFGLDIYPLWGGFRSALDYVHERAGLTAKPTMEAYYYRGEPLVPEQHLDETVDFLADRHSPPRPDDDLPPGASAYYRALLSGGALGWNARDSLWAEWLDRLLARHGRGVVWAHNTHVGDARSASSGATGASDGTWSERTLSIGEVVRDRYGAGRVVLIAFTGGTGEVMAATEPGGPMNPLSVPAPIPGSVDALLTASVTSPAVFLLGPDAAHWATVERGERAIGIVYDPAQDADRYVPTRLADRYDALCWFPTTTSVQALHLAAARRGELPGL